MTALPLVRKFTDAHGVEITFYEWPVASPKAAIQIAHGLGEHARRYDHVAEAFNRAGYSVYADDHRGHGETGISMLKAGLIKKQGNLGVGGMKATFDQVRELTKIIRVENKGLPIVLLGHSWGSMIAQRILNNNSGDYDAAILTGSALLVPGLMPSAGFNKKWSKLANANGFEWLSRDEKVSREFSQDPKNFPESATQAFGTLNAAQLMGIPSKKVRHDLPILMQAGSDDAIGGEVGNRRLINAYRRAGVEDLKLIVYSDARHEVFNEINKDEVIADTIAWVNERLGERALR